MLPVVLYWCDSWTLNINGATLLRVFENRVLRRMSVPERDEVTGGWKGAS
jgi:hypothetical protein